MTRLGLLTKNVDLFFRKTFNFAPEVPHMSFWMSIFCLHHELICRGSKIGCQIRETGDGWVAKWAAKDWDCAKNCPSYRSCPASEGAEISTATAQN